MTNITINSLPTASTIDAVNDILPIYTASSAATQSINRNTLLGLASAPVGLTDSQTLTNKILTSPTISGPTLSGTIGGTYTIGGTPTFPSSVVLLTSTQTLTNKTLTSPTINSPTITNATLSSDAITGFTTSNSGTIYGISVTTGQITTTNALGAGTVSPNALQSGTGTTFVWQSYTPTFTNLTAGNGTITAKYTQIGKTVHARVTFVLGSTSSISGDVSFTHPVTAAVYAGTGNLLTIGGAQLYNGSTSYIGFIGMASTSKAVLRTLGTGSNSNAVAVLSSTIPFTWATGNEFDLQYTYEAA